MADWTDRVVGDRMAVDREFSQRVASSEFTSQEWGLIMTAVEFEIEHPGDPDRARIVADTSKVPQVLPEMEKVRSQMGAMGAQTSDSGGSGGGGLLGAVKDALGLGGGGTDDETAQAAAALAQEYADELQLRLENTGKWDSVRTVAAEDDDGD